MDSSFQEQDSSWAPKQDMSLLCRVCANQQDYLIPIFEGEGLDHDMPTKMQKYLPVKVRETDKLPIQMCYQCASTIIAWSDLVTNCLEADKKLKGMLKINEKNAERKETESTLDDDTYDDSTHFDDTGDVGGGDDASDEDFEKEIKQLISDAGVELPSTSKNTRSTRKRKAEIVSKKSDTKRSKSDTSKAGLLKPKEEVQSGGEDRWECQFCHAECKNDCKCKSLSPAQTKKENVKESGELTSRKRKSLKLRLRDDKISSNENESMFCHYCNKSFIQKSKLRSHILKCLKRKKHKKVDYLDKCEINIYGNISFQCPVCQLILKRKQTLKIHLRAHTKEKLYTCDKCGKSYYSASTLKQHDKSVHLQIKDITCDVCGKAFSCQTYLTVHKRIHSGERPYICEQCGKSFTQRSILSLHKITHSQIKQYRYECSHCSRKFYNNFKLTEHLKIHSDSRPFSCDICSKSFKMEYEVKRHKRFVHTDERPFICNICNSSFKKPDHLKRHCRTHSEKDDRSVRMNVGPHQNVAMQDTTTSCSPSFVVAAQDLISSVTNMSELKS